MMLEVDVPIQHERVDIKLAGIKLVGIKLAPRLRLVSDSEESMGLSPVNGQSIGLQFRSVNRTIAFDDDVGSL